VKGADQAHNAAKEAGPAEKSVDLHLFGWFETTIRGAL
jgi:hypothetical protein